ncbi:MAG: DNA methyltransferase [Methylobacterium sp.]|uniref:MT-A70 family methyltransferase n=1 Tax=Methylobacterium sp. TaxID=409 RepID=UPI0025837613|nr:MT-A70 family methyltransferase [Methylobacterium sp.]MBY0296400.1 DNA methyltransferase [Methylobacterium sp.]
MTWVFDPLPPLSFDVIMIDPPWSFENWSEGGNGKNAKAQYDCMPIEEIAALPVGHLARGDAWLWLWATYPMLPDALHVMKRWGFAYVTGGPWVKRGASGKLAMGPGYVLRGNAEAFLLGKHGRPRTFSRSIRNVIEAPRREHSRKPDEAYETAERLFGPARRADVFSRQSRPGWEAWGREAGRFDEPALQAAE